MILEGRQIFTHMENTISMPAYMLDMAILHRQVHSKKVKDCPLCSGIFSVVPENFGNENFQRRLNKKQFNSKTKDYAAIEKERKENIEKLQEQHRYNRLLKLSFSSTRKRKNK